MTKPKEKDGLELIESYESSTGNNVYKYVYEHGSEPVIIELKLLEMLMDNLKAGDFYNQCQDVIDAVARIQHAHQNGGVGGGLKKKPKNYAEWSRLLLDTLHTKAKVFEFVCDYNKDKNESRRVKESILNKFMSTPKKDTGKIDLPGRDKVAPLGTLPGDHNITKDMPLREL